MQYKHFEYSIVQTANPTGWKWIIRLDETRSKTGIAFSRQHAIRFAEHAIEKLLKKTHRQAAGVPPPPHGQAVF